MRIARVSRNRFDAKSRVFLYGLGNNVTENDIQKTFEKNGPIL